MLLQAFANLARRTDGFDAVCLFDDVRTIDVEPGDSDSYETMLVLQQLAGDIGTQLAADRLISAEARREGEKIGVRPLVVNGQSLYCGIRSNADVDLRADVDRLLDSVTDPVQAQLQPHAAEARLASLIDEVSEGPAVSRPPSALSPTNGTPPPATPPVPAAPGAPQAPLLPPDGAERPPMPPPPAARDAAATGSAGDQPRDGDQPEHGDAKEPRYGSYRGVRYRID
jgi:hypothetical protein